MNIITQQRMAAVFNEWQKRYADNPASFGELVDGNGKPVVGYGERCVAYFEQIAADMDAKGQLPVPGV